MIRTIGDTAIRERHRASCHCGGVVLEIYLPDGIVDPRRCDCSMCRRKGYISATAGLDDITLISGADLLRLYQFNTFTARHYFCSNCGIHTHHQRRSNPQQYGFNVACLEGVNPLLLEDIKHYDGHNHPADRDDTEEGE